jgi:iron complex transport system substrate-binding protein
MTTFKKLLILCAIFHCALFPMTIQAALQAPVYTRIISLYPAHSENLSAMGLDKELIGIAASDTYPLKILTKQRFSHRDNAEKFIAAAPDLVLIRPMIARAVPQLITQLEHAGIRVISLQPKSISEMYDYWERLGVLCGREKEARQMVIDFKAGLQAIKNAPQSSQSKIRPKVYFESIHARMKTFAPASIALFVLNEAGGENLAVDAVARKNSNIAAYGKERIISLAATMDIYLAQQGRMNRVRVEDIRDEPGFQAIRAVREGKIFLVDEELVSRPTQRILIGIQKIKDILYP